MHKLAKIAAMIKVSNDRSSQTSYFATIGGVEPVRDCRSCTCGWPSGNAVLGWCSRTCCELPTGPDRCSSRTCLWTTTA